MENKEIKDFWENNPCGANLVLENNEKIESFRDFFLKYDAFRYSTEGHILDNLDRIDLKDKKVLEIGIGQAADSGQLINRGAKYFGIDITYEACRRAVLRFSIFNKPYKIVACADAALMPFADGAFDIVYSHGVLHHIPNIRTVIPELHRVLKQNGKLILMLYAKDSINYYFSILFMRRILLAGLYLWDKITLKKLVKYKLLRKHLDNAANTGLFKYLSCGIFLSKNTDGPDNPYSRVYSKEEAQRVFNLFSFYKCEQAFLNERHLPLFKLLPEPMRSKLAKQFGWHLWCYGVKR